MDKYDPPLQFRVKIQHWADESCTLWWLSNPGVTWNTREEIRLRLFEFRRFGRWGRIGERLIIAERSLNKLSQDLLIDSVTEEDRERVKRFGKRLLKLYNIR